MQNDPGHSQLKANASATMLAVFTTIAGPIFAMLVVISIAWFLIDICCEGPYVNRVKWVFTFFGFAAVLVSRISISEGPGRAAVFGLFLGVPTVAVSGFVMEGNFFLLAMIVGFVWWCAGRLTWDCTFVDSTRDATGQGMIDLAIDRLRGKKDENDAPPSTKLSEKRGDYLLPGPLETVRRFFFQRRQSNTPGLWAFYFLIGGAVFFGVGQTMIPVYPPEKHSGIAVNVLVYYVGVLGLLLVSGVTGLYRYLDRRKGKLPPQIARRWMVTGILIALVVVVVSWLLPRPKPEFSLGGLAGQLSSREKDPDSVSIGKDGQKEEKDKSGAGESGKQPADQGGQGSGERNQDKGEKADTSGSEKRPGEEGDSSEESENGNQKGKSGEQGSEGKSGKGKSADNRNKSKNKSDKKEEESGETGEQSDGNQSGGQSTSQSSQGPPQEPESPLSSAAEAAGNFAKWLIWLVAIAAAIFFMIRYRSRIVPWFHSFLAELLEFWNRLFGREKKPLNPATSTDGLAPDARRKLPGFGAYVNPFQSGAASDWPLDRLVFYTWEAFEAWSRDRNRPRLPEQTVLEFSRSSSGAFDFLGNELLALATMYSELNYSGKIESPESASGLSRLWEIMSARAESS
jgi:hypothetical protein